MDMRLTIENYKNLEGTWDNLTIVDVTETLKYYYFGCHYPGESTIHVVPLLRDSATLYGYRNIFYFVGVDGNTSQGVTPDWLADKANAKKTIADEFHSRYHHSQSIFAKKVNTTI